METQNNSEQENLERYVNSLNEKERQAYEIAKDHLGSSFSLYKSRGYLDWKKRNGL